MKSFLNYSKNRILYNIFRGLLVFSIVFLLNKCDVKALPSGEGFSEFATHKRELATAYVNNGSNWVSLYGNDGTGSSCGTLTSPNANAPLSCWGSRTLSLLTYDTSSAHYNLISFKFNSSTPLVVGNSYHITINYTLSTSSYSSISNQWKLDSNAFTIKDFSSTCSGINCTIDFNVINLHQSNQDIIWINFVTNSTIGSFNQFSQAVKYLFVPYVRPSTTSDGGSVNLGPLIEQNQTIIDQNNQTNNKLDGIQDALTDSSQPNTSDLENSAGWLPAGPVDSILNLPLTLFQSLLDNVGGSCSPVSLPIPFVNKSFDLPCFNALVSQIGGFIVWWNSIGVIAGAFILYKYLIHLYKWVDNVTSMNTTNNDWGGV